MKTLIVTVAAFALAASPSLAHVAKQHAATFVDPGYYALTHGPRRDVPADDGCIGLSSGTASASCGGTLTGGPSGGLN